MAQWSNVLEHFSENSSDSSRVSCIICNKSIACSVKQTTAFNTSNMRTHLDNQRAIPVNRRARSSTIMEGVEGWGGRRL